MGEIVAFKKSAWRNRKTSGDAAEGGAQILFFLGVRYQRMDDATAERLTREANERHDRPSGGGKRKRRARA